MRTTDADKDADLSESMTESTTDNADMDTAQVPGGGGQTIREICEANGLIVDSVRKRWNDRRKENPQMFQEFSKDIVPTPEQMAQIKSLASLQGLKVAKPKAKAAPAIQVAQQPRQEVAKATPAKQPTDWNAVIEKSTMLLFPGMVTIASVILTICGLYMFAAWAGGILGAMFGLVLVSAVVVARNRMKGGTSQQALDTVLWMEFGAFFLHCFTFHHLLPAVPGKFSLAIELGSAAVCAGFASFLSYRAVIMVRNYNAEVEDDDKGGKP